ncbi:aminotransferase class I/II-fold pyridoxal phosphate-dependent enzyme [Corynebacterium sputi]|uniref:aminotransferase class I/II-fold pyridoxal phosphate-dependent enzyme n=1 Tax=Corynebacterium sputi TaxID=489915 RepID=UPI00041D674B|nr:aminotransferase class I/II-fold pyridoxal phosphate-dependent enzyme [Corynebacterium sputi]
MDSPRTDRKDRTVTRLRPLGETVFSTVGALVVKHGAANLGQGKPDYPAPPVVLDEAQRQIASGNNQYAPPRGLLALREAVCSDRNARLGENWNATDECIITVGATEAIAATILGLVEPGDNVILIEPFYDSYRAAVAMAGATYTSVPLLCDGSNWHLDPVAIRAAITDDTTMIILNSPHNPTGAVFPEEEIREVAVDVVKHDLLVLSDEVYEHLNFGAEHEHTSIASLPGMRERTVIASSAGKTFNLTGWKVGWALGAPELIEAVSAAKQFLSFGGAAPLEPAVIKGFTESPGWHEELRQILRDNHSMLITRLQQMGLTVYPADAGYFVLIDGSPIIDAVSSLPAVQAAGVPVTNAFELCMCMPEFTGIGAIPVSSFVHDDTDPHWANLLRISFCQKPESINRALDVLEELLE